MFKSPGFALNNWAKVLAHVYSVYLTANMYMKLLRKGWLGPQLCALLEELYVFSREFPLEEVPLNLQLTEFVISWHTCKETFLASSGTWKPSCSRYFVSMMINPNSGAKSAKYCKLGCEAEAKSKRVLGCLLWFTENDASLPCQLTALSKSLHYFYKTEPYNFRLFKTTLLGY